MRFLQTLLDSAAGAAGGTNLKFRKNEQYVITCLPMNDLPDTLEGRVAMAEDFVNARIKQGEPEQAPTPLANPQAPPTSSLVPNPNAPALAAA